MKQHAKTERRPRPKLPRIPEEMQQWSDLLLREILGWPDSQFAADVRHDGRLPRQCNLWRAAAYARYGYSLLGQLQNPVAESEPEETAGGRLPYPVSTRDAKWISFELQSGDDLPDAIRGFARAYRPTAKGGETR